MVRPKGRQGTQFGLYIPNATIEKLKALSEKTDTPQSHLILEGIGLVLDKYASVFDAKLPKVKTRK